MLLQNQFHDTAGIMIVAGVTNTADNFGVKRTALVLNMRIKAHP